MLKRTAKILVAGIALISVILGCSAGEKTISIRFKFVEGSNNQYRQITKFSKNIYKADTLAWHNIGESRYEIRETVTGILESGNGEVKIQAKAEHLTTNRDNAALTDTTNQTYGYFITMQSNGKVVALRPDPSQTDPVDQSWADFQKQLLEQGSPQFPEGDIPVGHTWTHRTTVVLPDEVSESSMTFKVSSLAREGGYDCAVIEYEGNMVVPVNKSDSDSTSTTGIERYLTTGLMYFALTEGRIILQRDHVVINADLEMVINDHPDSARVVHTLDIEYRLIRAGI